MADSEVSHVHNWTNGEQRRLCDVFNSYLRLTKLKVIVSIVQQLHCSFTYTCSHATKESTCITIYSIYPVDMGLYSIKYRTFTPLPNTYIWLAQTNTDGQYWKSGKKKHSVSDFELRNNIL